VNKQLPGRNDPCICGSGKKYKKCCLGLSGRASIVKADPGLNLKKAQQYMINGDLSRAESVFIEALKNDKNSVDVLVGLGQCLCQQWRNNEGIPLLLRAGKILIRRAGKARDIRHLLDLAYLMINLQASDKALPLLNEALAITSDYPRAHHTKALALQKKNPKDALLSSKRAVELAPDESNAVILLAALEAKQGDLMAAKTRLHKLIDTGVAVDLARASLELAVILDKLGDYVQAYSYFSGAGKLNQKKPEVIAIDKEAVYLDIERSKQVFDMEYLQNCGDKINDQLPAPVFLIGFYRSGTTLMEQILGAHPQVVTSDEAYIIPSVAREITRISEIEGTIQEKVKALTEEQVAELRKFYWQTAERIMGEKLSDKVFVDKTAMNTLNLGLINTLFPDATVLFVLRDPRDVILSCFMQSFGFSPLTVHFLDWAGGARFYSSVMNYWLHVRNHLAMSWMELRYEDVLTDMEGQFRPVFERLGLDWVSECEQFHKHARAREISTPSYDQVTRPIYRSSVQRWRHYEKYFLEIEDDLDFFVLQFGYGFG
jgi:Tfp pilus assembly protein PilF